MPTTKTEFDAVIVQGGSRDKQKFRTARASAHALAARLTAEGFIGVRVTKRLTPATIPGRGIGTIFTFTTHHGSKES